MQEITEFLKYSFLMPVAAGGYALLGDSGMCWFMLTMWLYLAVIAWGIHRLLERTDQEEAEKNREGPGK